MAFDIKYVWIPNIKIRTKHLKNPKYLDKDGNLSPFTEKFLVSLGKEKASRPEGLQAISDEGGKNKISSIDGFDYEELSGYCIVWSYLRLELRLRSPLASAVDLEKGLREQLKKRDEKPALLMGRFIRNYTDAFLVELSKVVGKKNLLDYIGNRSSPEEKKKINLALLGMIDNLVSEKQKQEIEDMKMNEKLLQKTDKKLGEAKTSALVLFDFAYANDYFSENDYTSVANEKLFDYMLDEIKRIGNKGGRMTDEEQKFLTYTVHNENDLVFQFYKRYAPKSLTNKVKDYDWGGFYTELSFDKMMKPSNKRDVGKMIKNAIEDEEFDDYKKYGINDELYYTQPYEYYIASITEKKQAIDFIRSIYKIKDLLNDFYNTKPDAYGHRVDPDVFKSVQEFLKRHNFKI